jgi:hypothetical protein
MSLEQKIETILERLTSIESKVDLLQSEVSSLANERVKNGGFSTDDLKNTFSDFKDRWDSESPEISGLKDSLLKLRNSLGGLTEVLTQPTNEDKQTEEKG